MQDTDSSQAAEAYAALRYCFVHSHQTYCRKRRLELAPAEAEKQANALLDAYFSKSSLINPAFASRRGMEHAIEQLNAVFGFTDDPDLLEDHNMTLHLYISDLQEAITLL